MEKLTDDVVAVSIVQETKQNYARLRSVSMAKGFHGTDNQAGLKEIVEWVVMPSQGRLSAVDRAREDDPEFVRLRHYVSSTARWSPPSTRWSRMAWTCAATTVSWASSATWRWPWSPEYVQRLGAVVNKRGGRPNTRTIQDGGLISSDSPNLSRCRNGSWRHSGCGSSAELLMAMMNDIHVEPDDDVALGDRPASLTPAVFGRATNRSGLLQRQPPDRRPATPVSPFLPRPAPSPGRRDRAGRARTSRRPRG